MRMNGGRSVMTTGVTTMLRWPADNLASLVVSTDQVYHY